MCWVILTKAFSNTHPSHILFFGGSSALHLWVPEEETPGDAGKIQHVLFPQNVSEPFPFSRAPASQPNRPTWVYDSGLFIKTTIGGACVRLGKAWPSTGIISLKLLSDYCCFGLLLEVKAANNCSVFSVMIAYQRNIWQTIQRVSVFALWRVSKVSF